MIRALEQHLAAWAKGQLEALAAQSGLFGSVRTVVGSLDLPNGPPMGADEVAVLVQVQSLAPEPENRDLGPAPVTDGPMVHLAARVALRLIGRNVTVGAGGGRQVSPPGAQFHRVDLAALTLLALLRERPGPAPDGAPTPLDAELGARVAGAATAARGARSAFLSWSGVMVSDTGIVPENARNDRQWDIALTASCAFRLSPAPLEGGRIVRIESETALQDTGLRLSVDPVYGSVDTLPLSWFTGLGDAVLTELMDHEVSTLGDLGRIGGAGTANLAGELRTASSQERTVLGQLAAMAELRRGPGFTSAVYAQDADLMALPARALLAPTPEEAELISQVVTTPELSNQIAVYAVPVASALQPGQRDRVAVGTLLIRR